LKRATDPALFTLTACSAEAPPGAPSEDDAVESIGSIKSELIVSVTDPAAYLTSCWDNNVPKPPLWGRDNIGPGKNWLSRGQVGSTENFLGIGVADIFLANPLQKDGNRGVCVIAAHSNGTFGSFDVILPGR
jgi:hypothetical protein